MGEVLLWWLLATAWGAPVGWRHDGSGAWPVEVAPTSWSLADAAWSTPLPRWSNASPVPAGGLVCAAVEPVTLVCLDAATGAVRWQADHPVWSALAEPRRSEVMSQVARVEQLEATFVAARAAYSQAMRAARAGGDGAALVAATEALGQAKTALEAAPDPRTPPDQGIVGWSSATPVSDGEVVVGLFANGVVAAHELDGRVRWAHWLGAPASPMLGWDEGHAASPVIAAGVVVVPFGHLTAIDLATGEVVWTGEAWPHFGSPAVAVVDGVPLIVSPSGAVVRAEDGQVVRSGLAEPWYVGPVVRGSWVWFLEARADSILREQGGADLVAWTLDGLDGDTLRATPRWRTRVPEVDTFYAAPVVAGEQVHVVTHTGRLWTLGASDGVIAGSLALDALRPTEIWSSPAAAAGRLYITDERGRTVVLSQGASPQVLGVSTLAPTRASPAFAGSRMYVRTADGMVAVEASR